MKYWKRKELVRNLRGQGLSYKEIRQRIPFTIAKSTVSDWCKDIELTDKQKARLSAKYDILHRGAKANQIKRAEEIKQIKRLAEVEISPMNRNEFKLAGLMLYWAEGAKSRYIDITNSDPLLIKFMITWLRNICRVSEERFRVSLHLHSGQNEEQIKKYWSKITGISISQFGKSYIKKEGSGYRKNILYNGTIKIRVCDSNLLHRVLGWIEGVNKNKWAISSIGRAIPS